MKLTIGNSPIPASYNTPLLLEGEEESELFFLDYN